MASHCKFFLSTKGRCTNRSCEYQHNTEHKRLLNATPCKFAGRCNSQFCPYNHGGGGNSGQKKQNNSPKFCVETLKGRRADFNMSLDATVYQVKAKCAELLNFDANDMDLMLGAKILEDDAKTLKDYKVAMHNGVGRLTAVERFFGGGPNRTGAAEVAVQLKYARKAHNIVGVDLIDDDVMRWRVCLLGPDSGPFRHGLFHLRMEFSADYPYKRPDVIFECPMFHPNVYTSGTLCWNDNDNSGQKFWADVLIGGINRILLRPNPGSPANSAAARLLRSNPSEYERQARSLLKIARV